ncbi:Alpha-D-ribose 1-methylphosphonate 5-triphosphate synthase subunit PhnH [Falsiruegeria litorea R37]|uniref:Alpha-D-ribose 1-methylphosphonate 5-triphosphate synthase subunit PhnH n=1 Tax=Falsiruegeria litorea R37 TaxID=1200284 RepID=A0A1Y5RR43_9RHOB|nr:phosphonate C-P lyase system protein PhnH [Falsiruegeria litorea]SLN23423.1 Alpha-D-ribose 1-methylphosphonate 5-triphosphate synthase subunit PhnH [Falsiruegeria litorea R37]
MQAQATQFAGGFTNAPVDAAHAFRAAMTVMARPGEIRTLTGAQAPAPLSEAAATLLLTLCDPETKVHLAGEADTPEVRGWLTFHTGAPLVDAGEADFAIGTWESLIPLGAYKIGTSEYPDRSATLIVECTGVTQTGATMTGPGIKESAQLSLPDVEVLRTNATAYPLGLDFFFTSGTQVAALPRSTQISEG